MRTRHLWPSFLPVPLLAVLIAILHQLVPFTIVFEPPWLLPITNTLFVTLVCFAVAYLAARNYRATGRAQVLLLGGGVLAFGIAAVVAGWLRHVPEAGANLNVTVYNVGALVAGTFHFAAAAILLTGLSLEARIGRKRRWLALAYVGPAVLMTLLTAGTVAGLVPLFFVQDVGPTALRQAVLGAADLMFVFSFLVLMGTYLRNRERFLFWYSSALALTAISLTAFLVEQSVGGAVGWAGRLAQYLGGAYFLVAIVTARRSAKARKTTFDDVLTASLSPAEEKFRALAANSPDLIARFDGELRHLYVNPACLSVYGKPGATVIGKNFEEANLPGAFSGLWRERICTVFERAEPVEVEGHLPTCEGMRFFHSRCVPELGPDGVVANVLVVSHDLTARRRAEEMVRAQNTVLDGINRIFRSALASESEQDLGRCCLKIAEEVTGSKFGILAERNARTGRLDVIAISDPGWQVCGIEDPSARGSPPAQGFPIHGLYSPVMLDGIGFFTNDPASCPASIGTRHVHSALTAFLGVPLMQNETTFGMLAVGNREGGYRPDDLAALEALAGPTVQVLMRRRAEEALGQSEEWFRALAEALPEIAWTADASGGIEWFNQRWYDYTGLARGIGHGWSWDCVVHPDDMAGTLRRWQDALRNRNTFENEIRCRSRDGQYRWFLVRSWPLRDAAGSVVRWFGTNTDVEELKQVQAALEDLNATLEARVAERTSEVQHQADQLRALAAELTQVEQRERKRLAAILHDHLQQLLVAAHMQLAMLKRTGDARVRSTTQAIASIMNEAITVSRSLAVELSPPILHQAGLGAALGWLASRIEEKNQFKVRVRADHDAAPQNENLRFLLFEGVRELLLNAVKHSGAREAEVVMLRGEEGGTRIVVTDTGRGFEPAVRMRQGSNGGLGLFSIQQRLAHFGGRLEIESAPGRGTRAVLDTPPEEAAAAVKEVVPAVPAAAPGAPEAWRPGRKISVLLVDDHAIVRQGLASLLRPEPDIEIAGEATDGKHAVELARQHSPDVVVMDVNMPGMDGVEATRIIVAELPRCKVIGLSMHIDHDIGVAMREAGAVGYLSKGGPSEDLVAAIRASVSREALTADRPATSPPNAVSG
jgi:PAS domain S-box-containing protein